MSKNLGGKEMKECTEDRVFRTLYTLRQAFNEMSEKRHADGK
jgi:hypothetical protein